ncbi:SURF4 family-domain-containing protein [Dichotomocladium elegans]|nr:SURF4 family-domain-containing protein [Dichotomocladium elegans]
MSDLKSRLEEFSSKAEELLDRVGQPLKPYIPAAGRFLIVATFMEDAIRIPTQWEDQVVFMEERRHFPWGLSHLFLALNVIVMAAGSGMVIAKKYTSYAVYGLLGTVVAQAFGYGLVFDFQFFLRNLSLIGGLMMVLSESMLNKDKKSSMMFAALPQLSDNDRRTYIQLAGRILLIFLFIGSAFHGDEWSLVRIVSSLLGLVASIMVVVGFKARWSAMFMVLFLSVFNILINNFWSTNHGYYKRDILKYDFFQTLSIVGGFLLLVNMGPGGYSIDEKKKIF